MPRPSALTTQQIKDFKDAIERGETIKSAMMNELGMAESTASRGKAGLSKRVLNELMKRGVKFAEIGKQMTPEFQENFVRGKLFSNAIEGKDKAYNSLKLMGQDKRVNMFTADSIAGVIVIEQPRALPALPIDPVTDTIDAE